MIAMIAIVAMIAINAIVAMIAIIAIIAMSAIIAIIAMIAMIAMIALIAMIAMVASIAMVAIIATICNTQSETLRSGKCTMNSRWQGVNMTLSELLTQNQPYRRIEAMTERERALQKLRNMAIVSQDKEAILLVSMLAEIRTFDPIAFLEQL